MRDGCSHGVKKEKAMVYDVISGYLRVVGPLLF